MPPKEIQFTTDPPPRYVFERDCVWFPAQVDGDAVSCLVSLQLLMHRFGLREWDGEAALDCFQQHREAIQQLAWTHIERGWISPDNEVLLTRRYTRLTITYGPGLRLWSGVRALAEENSRQLIQLIGPFADEVFIDWDRGEAETRPVVTLRISDSSRSVSAIFEVEDLTRPSRMQVRLPRVWGDFLQLRSEKHLEQLLSGRVERGDG